MRFKMNRYVPLSPIGDSVLRARFPQDFSEADGLKFPILPQLELALEALLLLPPMERVDAVRPLWKSMTQDKRAELLAVDVETLRETAKQVAKTAVLHAGKR